MMRLWAKRDEQLIEVLDFAASLGKIGLPSTWMAPFLVFADLIRVVGQTASTTQFVRHAFRMGVIDQDVSIGS